MMPITTSRAMHTIQDKSIETPIVTLAEKVDFKNKTVVLLNALSPFSAGFFPHICRKYGLSEPLHAFILASGLSSQMTIQRIDDHALEIELEKGFLSSKMDFLFREPSNPMQIGETVDMGGIRVEVLSLTKDLRPLKVRFSFARSLDDPSLLFCQWKADRYVPLTLPQKGKAIVLKRTASEFIAS